MSDAANIAALGAVLGDPARARMVAALMDGRALTASELAVDGGVAASTASTHLARLVDAGIATRVAQGRHRYYRLADAQVAATVEALMRLPGRVAGPRVGPRDEALRAARVCYDHLAGEAGVKLYQDLQAANILRVEQGPILTAAGMDWCRRLGIDPDVLSAQRPPLCRACLDWSERRDHLAGSLGAALLRHLFAQGYVRRVPATRALWVTTSGRRFFDAVR